MLRGKGSIKPVRSERWGRVGTVAAVAGRRCAQRGEGHLKSSGITSRRVAASQSDRDPCEVTILEGVFLGAWTDTFVEVAGTCLR